MARRNRISVKRALQKIGTRLQEAQARRLLSGRSASGGAVAPLDPDTVRVTGAAGGVDTGAMARELRNPANLKIERETVSIRLPATVRDRWTIYNRGSPTQPARPVGGIAVQDMERARRELARQSRDEILRLLTPAARRRR